MVQVKFLVTIIIFVITIAVVLQLFFGNTRIFSIVEGNHGGHGEGHGEGGHHGGGGHRGGGHHSGGGNGGYIHGSAMDFNPIIYNYDDLDDYYYYYYGLVPVYYPSFSWNLFPFW